MTDTTPRLDTLTEFLTAGDSHYAIFDMGRLVRCIPNDKFSAIENGLQPYPTPLQQHAWLGVLFWSRTTKAAPYIWFIKFPLDERGLINHAARQHFLQIIVEALGNNITADPNENQQKKLSQNPYLFTPDEPKRAAFHAKASLYMNQPASIYFEDAQAYIEGQREPASWQQLGLQGLHDVAVRTDNSSALEQAIIEQWKRWPEPFISTLLLSLEHHSLSDNLAAHIAQQISDKDLTPQQLITHLRGLSGTKNPLLMQQILTAVLTDYESSPALSDILIIIAARLWPALSDSSLRHRYIELAATQPDIFPHLMADLVALPDMRLAILELLQNPAAYSKAVQDAVMTMKKQVRNV